jgi:hypothetical protein
LKEVYAREAALQSRLAQQDRRTSQRDQQLNALRAERDALSRRVDELEKQLGGGRSPQSQSSGAQPAPRRR